MFYLNATPHNYIVATPNKFGFQWFFMACQEHSSKAVTHMAAASSREVVPSNIHFLE